MPFHQLSSRSDQDIIYNLLQEGADRRKAEEQLFTQYAYFIEQARHKYGFGEDEAFTIYADTVIAAISKINEHSFEGRSSLKTWLFQIFHHKCVDLVRKKTTNKSSVHRTGDISTVLQQMADSAKTVVQQMMDDTDISQLKQKLNQVGENCRQLLLHWANGFSDKEIATLFEYKTADVVKTTRLRCLDKLRQLYKTL